MLESELFGYMDGALPEQKGAAKRQVPAGQRWDDFLDETGDMPSSMQAKLTCSSGERN